MKADKPTALLVGGGEGMGKLELTLKALSNANVDCQVWSPAWHRVLLRVALA